MTFKIEVTEEMLEAIKQVLDLAYSAMADEEEEPEAFAEHSEALRIVTENFFD